MAHACWMLYGIIWNRDSKFGNIVGLLEQFEKRRWKNPVYGVFLLIERLKIGVLGENKLKKSLKIEKNGF